MHEPTMNALDFHRIREELASYTSCQMGKELALAIGPLPSLPEILRVQKETAEAKGILAEGRSVPFGGIRDVRTLVERAANGGVLSPEQLQAMADTIYGCRHLHRFLTEHASRAPLISRYAAQFDRFDLIEEEIRRCIEPGGVSSSASRSLREIRREIATLQGRIQDRLNGLLRQVRQHLQDGLVTTRNGRYVIPVKASSRSAVPGTVHGSSASGATLFVEPDAIRHLSDELDSWQAMEEEEVERILVALSGLVAGKADELAATLGAVAELDLIFARGRLSQAWSAEPVSWNETGLIELKGARHPLLGKAAVGNTIEMSREQRMLIVTGPNTGGKTLLLKTFGLLVLLARCGLHIPVEPGSTLCFFDEVFADIGDQQSLEQSLSTFSSHIANIAPILNQAGPRTVVLLDELGSGTDLAEGTALGIALLEAFLKSGACTLVTTHLREIKEFGQITPGCAIAGMGFDAETLRPTYRMIYGAMGESQGLAIAARAGLPLAVVNRAYEVLNGNQFMPGPSEMKLQVPQPHAHSSDLPRPAAPSVGATPTLASVGTTAASPAETGALVLTPSLRRCRVWLDDEERDLPLSDTLRKERADGLVMGDRVRHWQGQITSLVPRRNALACRDADTFAETAIAANLDRLLILTSARKPDFHAGVLARHLFWAEYSGVTPIIGLTKADLLPRGEAETLLRPFRTAGYETVTLDLMKGQGVDRVAEAFSRGFNGVISVPGAGKSTLLKRLGCTSGADDRTKRADGRQWPPLPRLLRLGTGGWLADVPGLRELGVWKPDLTAGFREFAPYSAACASPGCLHRRADRGCEVQAAAADGRLPAERLQQYSLLIGLMGLA